MLKLDQENDHSWSKKIPNYDTKLGKIGILKLFKCILHLCVLNGVLKRSGAKSSMNIQFFVGKVLETMGMVRRII